MFTYHMVLYCKSYYQYPQGTENNCLSSKHHRTVALTIEAQMQRSAHVRTYNHYQLNKR